MSELRKTYEGGVFFLTMTVVGWIDVFTRSLYADVIIDSLNYCIAHKGLAVYAYVVMPSHLHMVAARNEGNLNDVIRDFKSHTAKAIIREIAEHQQESRKEWLLYMFRYYAKYQKQNKEFMFWQKTNHPTDLTDARMVAQKIDYIHQNPIEAGYVDEPHHWRYSSAYPLNPVKLLAV